MSGAPGGRITLGAVAAVVMVCAAHHRQVSQAMPSASAGPAICKNRASPQFPSALT